MFHATNRTAHVRNLPRELHVRSVRSGEHNLAERHGAIHLRETMPQETTPQAVLRTGQQDVSYCSSTKACSSYMHKHRLARGRVKAWSLSHEICAHG